MSSGPYTYVTLSMHPGKTPRVGVSFHTPAIWVRSGVLEDQRPYLDLVTDEANVSISSTGAGSVTDADVNTAREIFNAATHYLTECERLHTEQSTTKATDDPAA
jgi:hypothetical protein